MASGTPSLFLSLTLPNRLKAVGISVEGRGMIVRRGYRLGLVATMLAAGGYVGLTQIQAAESRTDARADARQAVVDAAADRAFEARATALVKSISLPRTFSNALASVACTPSATLLCARTTTTPRVALRLALPAVAATELKLTNQGCDDPAKLSAKLRLAMGTLWLPCHAIGKANGVGISVVAFPEIDHARSSKGHLVFSSTLLSVTAVQLP